MKPPVKIGLALVLGVAAAIGLAVAFRQHAETGREGLGVTLEFEPVNSQASLADMEKVVGQRLEGLGAMVGRQGGHVTVWIPYPEPRQKARVMMEDVRLNMRKTMAPIAKVEAIVLLDESDRVVEMKRLAPPGSAQEQSLQELALATDGLMAAQGKAATRPADSPAARQAVAEAQESLRRARIDFFTGRLTVEALEQALAEGGDSVDSAAATQAELVVKYPAQATEILQMIAARRAWRAAGGGSGLEPEEVEQLATARGELEFRKVLAMKEIDALTLADAVDRLWTRGPAMPVKVGSKTAVWVPSSDRVRRQHPDFVAAMFGGEVYLLCSDEPGEILVHGGKREAWASHADAPTVDSMSGDVVLTVHLDTVGVRYRGELSSKAGDSGVGIVWNGRVIGVPRAGEVQGNDTVEIGWERPAAAHGEGFGMKEAQAMGRELNSGVLPGELRRVK